MKRFFNVVVFILMMGSFNLSEAVVGQVVSEKLVHPEDFVAHMQDYAQHIHAADISNFKMQAKLTRPETLQVDTSIIHTTLPQSISQHTIDVVSKNFVQELVKQYGYYNQNQDVVYYVNLLGHYLISVLPTRKQYSFGILDIDSVRTFSSPTGQIFVTRGLLENVSSEAELAYALAREIIVVEHNYLLQSELASVETLFNFEKLDESLGKEAQVTDTTRIEKQATSYNSDIFDTVEYFTSSHYNTLLDAPGNLIDRLVKDLIEHKYSKDYIENIDRLGMNYCLAAGYDMQGMKDLISLYGKHGFGIDPTSRILAIENKAVYVKGREGLILRKKGKMIKERYVTNVLAKLHPEDYKGYKDKVISFIKGQY